MRRHRVAPPDVGPTATDGALAHQAGTGDLGAFEELYRRHAQAAWRVAQSVTGNAEDAADAVSEAFAKVLKAVSAHKLQDADRFRAYLLTATRNAALDVQRRRGRVRPTDIAETFDGPAIGNGPSDALEDGTDRDMVVTAFRSLPERWRSVLWLTEVEGIPPREAADMLGVSANGVAQLAVRARAGLRQRFLQAHVSRNDVDDTCRFTVERLGAYVAGGLSPRDLAKVDQHLAACGGCRMRLEELEDLGGSLRRIVLPFPIGLAALSLGKWQASAAASTTAAGAAPGGAGAGGIAANAASTPRWLLAAQRPLAVASVGLFAAGIVGAGVVGQSSSLRAPGRERAAPVESFTVPTVVFAPAVALGSDDLTGDGPGGAGSGSGGGGVVGDSVATLDELARSDDGGEPSGTTTTTVAPPPGTTTTTTPPPTTTTTQPRKGDANLYVKVGDTTLDGAVGGSCTGGSVDGTSVQCAPAPPDEDYTVIVEAPIIGRTTVPKL